MQLGAAARKLRVALTTTAGTDVVRWPLRRAVIGRVRFGELRVLEERRSTVWTS